ncbi:MULTISPECIES: DUF4398 domain-containing protein [Sorangium]|uniref:DUF4398 domain-containing protein n=1 Tax=Sorangium cellulosum TaxID=56 RepID=A0A4P2QIT4_SORCE|nr:MULTISPECIES: DUF4398 domain-containing protein [Sorangium]AUX29511.1 uncharacterized protein SOCE836_016010 [Sorangium cellulosum]WCQ88907.1 hypothetical protein NQZ70_01589 [Sorangium sp. Soce836]
MRAGAPLAMALSLAGCARGAAGPPPELVTARAAVVQAQDNPLSPLAIAELKRAEQALAIAEREARERPRSAAARDAAYVARRRAQCSLLTSLVRANQSALARARQTLEGLRARGARGARGPAARDRPPALPDDVDLEPDILDP